MAKPAKTTEPGTAVAPVSISQRAMGVMTIGGREIKIKKQVTLPLLKQKVDSAVYIKIDAAYYVGKKIKEIDKKTGKEIEREPAILVNVINLEDGRLMQYIVPAILRDTWDTEYADNAYVGKGFAINKLPADAGKRYNNIQITELDLENLE